MALFLPLQHCLRFLLLALFMTIVAFATKCRIQPPPSPPCCLTGLFPCTFYNKGFANFWAPCHEIVSDDQNHARLILDALSGSGFKSLTAYTSGFFNVALKLPANEYTAGVITTFYMSNEEIYEHQEDEIRFEFLGRFSGEDYVLQTNVCVNGSTDIGREQRFRLWFDPTTDYHDYSIQWTTNNIVLYVDDIPIREYPNISTLNSQYPAKPMYVYATILKGSDEKTDKLGRFFTTNCSCSCDPFVASYSNFILNGCAVELKQPTSNFLISAPSSCDPEFQKIIRPSLTAQQRQSLEWVQKYFVIYDYCKDKQRYPNPLPECTVNTTLKSIDSDTHFRPY